MKSIKNRLLFNFYYLIFWVGYFIFARAFFLAFHFKRTSDLSVVSVFKTFFYGLQLDVSFAAYLAVIPFFIIFLSIWIPKKIVNYALKIYTIPLIFLIILLMFIDANLYNSWGVRVDSTLLTYINTPKIMLASVGTFQLIFGIFIWLFVSLIITRYFLKWTDKLTNRLEKGSGLEAPVFLLLIGFLILPIRGGLQTIPVNQSNVYFSNNMFANHAAVNFVWNFANTLTHKTYDKNPYEFFDKKVALKIINKNREPLLKAAVDSVLTTDKPNVILIIWESLTAKLVAPLGGEPNVTENINKLSKEGLLFTNFYANGDRTDKGLIALLSGYYPQTNTSIIKMPNKTRSLPMLTKEMKKLGYTTAFYYGGDTNFGNMNTYLHNGEVDEVIDGLQFDKKDWNSKWGVHDHIMLKRFFKDINANSTEKPFFKIALTLTSHEPFEFPDVYKFGKKGEENKFRSAHAYTDKSIGNFIAQAKKQDWYKNTLIIIVADHGHAMPKHQGYYNSPKKFKIPMLWLGGALAKKHQTVNVLATQTDLAYTLLDLLQGDNSSFVWSKHLFADKPTQYAHYIFNNGFGTIGKNGLFVYDYVSNKAVIQKGKQAKQLDSLGKAITQNAFQDFMDRK